MKPLLPKESLMDLSSKEHQIYLEILENEGEILPEVEQMFLDTREKMAEKVDAYHEVLKLAEKQIERYDEKIEEFKAQKKFIENAVERMKDTLACVMRGRREDRLQGNFWEFKLVKSKDSVEFANLDVEELPEEIVTTKVTKTVSKTKVLEHWSKLPESIQRKFSLRPNFHVRSGPKKLLK